MNQVLFFILVAVYPIFVAEVWVFCLSFHRWLKPREFIHAKATALCVYSGAYALLLDPAFSPVGQSSGHFRLH